MFPPLVFQMFMSLLCQNDELRGASGRGDVHAVASLLYAGVDANAVDQVRHAIFNLTRVILV